MIWNDIKITGIPVPVISHLILPITEDSLVRIEYDTRYRTTPWQISVLGGIAKASLSGELHDMATIKQAAEELLKQTLVMIQQELWPQHQCV